EGRARRSRIDTAGSTARRRGLRGSEAPRQPDAPARRPGLWIRVEQQAERALTARMIRTHGLDDADDAHDPVHERECERVRGVIPGVQTVLAQLAVIVEAARARPRPRLGAGVLAADDFAIVARAPAHELVPHAGAFGAQELSHRLEVVLVARRVGAGVGDRELDRAVATHV